LREERLRVLQMVAEGKVSPEEADKVLSAMESADRVDTFRAGPPPPPRPPIPPSPPAAMATAHYGIVPAAHRLKLVAERHDGSEVNVTWPLGKVKDLGGALPAWAREVLAKCEVDLNAFAGLELSTGLGEVLSVSSEVGDEVRISLEE